MTMEHAMEFRTITNVSNYGEQMPLCQTKTVHLVKCVIIYRMEYLRACRHVLKYAYKVD